MKKDHDTRGFVETDDLKELFYDPTANKTDQFEQLMVLFGIPYNKRTYDIFVTIIKYISYLLMFLISIIYLVVICIVLYRMAYSDYITGSKLAGIIMLHLFVIFFIL